MKRRRIIGKIVITVILCILLMYAYFHGVECIYLKYFHIICPGCGMTRAIRALTGLKFVEAFSYHPMVYSLPIVFLYIIMDGRVFKQKIINNGILLLIGLGFVINYAIKLVYFFA